MQGQQENLSELSRSHSTDKPKHQENTNIDGKSQEIMHMPRNLTFKMQIINGKMLLIWKLNRSKNTKYSKNMGKLFMTRIKLEILPRVHFVFDVKHCGKFKARLVAVGHLTKEPKKPMETVYSGAVSLRNLKKAMFLAELNNLELWGADVGKCICSSTYKRETLHCGWF